MQGDLIGKCEHVAYLVGDKQNAFLEMLGFKLRLILRAAHRAVCRKTFVRVRVVKFGMVNPLIVQNATHRRSGKERCRQKQNDVLLKPFHLNSCVLLFQVTHNAFISQAFGTITI